MAAKAHNVLSSFVKYMSRLEKAHLVNYASLRSL